MTSRILVLGTFLCACAGSQEPAAAAPAPVVAAPETTSGVAETSAAPPVSAAPVASLTEVHESSPAAEPAPASAKEERPAGVTARSIGMHIGGGPNDAATKAPFTRTIESAFDAMIACTASVPEDRRKGTFGVDLLIGKDGGKPAVTNPRTGLPGDDFKACVASVFEGLSFDKPKRGATKLSYSLRFDVK